MRHGSIVPTQSPIAKVLLTSLAILSLIGVAYAAWDYRRVSQIYLAQALRASAYREDTLEKIKGSWLFSNQVLFAELSITELRPENAARVNALAQELLHFSPEARVVEKLVESSVMLGKDEEALAYLTRYRAAFPAEHARWAKQRDSLTVAPASTN